MLGENRKRDGVEEERKREGKGALQLRGRKGWRGLPKLCVVEGDFRRSVSDMRGESATKVATSTTHLERRHPSLRQRGIVHPH
jgi:hypothetical protein